MATVSYGLRIVGENHIFDETIRVYRDAVRYLMAIVRQNYEELEALKPTGRETLSQARQQYVERLVHSAGDHRAAYARFDREFKGFPSYLRRAAITAATGKITSYVSWCRSWEKEKKGKRPFLKASQDVFPCFFKGNTFLREGSAVKLKLYDGSKWDWHELKIRKCDLDYAEKYFSDWKASAPFLIKRGRRYELRVSYTKKNSLLPAYTADKDIDTVLGVRFGEEIDAVCAAVKRDGSCFDQLFIDNPKEKDRLEGILQAIEKAGENGSENCRRLHRFADNYNSAIAVNTAVSIVDFAQRTGSGVIIFEYPGSDGRALSQRPLEGQRRSAIQTRTGAIAKRHGIRTAFVNAENASELAFDGSGRVTRGKAAGLDSPQLCRFADGRIYNNDLSAAKNIGARYFVRSIIKSSSEREVLQLSAKVPEVCRRIDCVLASLISINAGLRTVRERQKESFRRDEAGDGN